MIYYNKNLQQVWTRSRAGLIERLPKSSVCSFGFSQANSKPPPGMAEFARILYTKWKQSEYNFEYQLYDCGNELSLTDHHGGSNN